MQTVRSYSDYAVEKLPEILGTNAIVAVTIDGAIAVGSRLFCGVSPWAAAKAAFPAVTVSLAARAAAVWATQHLTSKGSQQYVRFDQGVQLIGDCATIGTLCALGTISAPVAVGCGLAAIAYRNFMV